MSAKIILFAIPFFFLLIGAEWLFSWVRKKKLYTFSDAVVNLCVGIGNQAFGLLMKAVMLGLYMWFYDQFAFLEWPLTWWSILLCVVLFDFLFYWAHRWGHEVNFFWGAHVVHHQSEEYNLSVALRQSWWHNFIAFFIFLPLPILGFQPEIFFPAAGIHTVYQFWIHTKAVGKLPRWIEFWLNTPSHHRVHHGVNPKYLDRNYAGVFIVWDRLFGTFQEEEEEVIYGITTPLRSLNPVWSNLHYYVEMWAKMRRMGKFGDRLRMIWAKPGWLPKDMGGPQPLPALDARAPKYDPKSSGWMKAYVGVQFGLLALGLVAFMLYFTELDWFYRLAFFAIIILSGMICGAMLENKRWVLLAEYQRLALVVVCLNVLYYQSYLDWFLVMLIASMSCFLLFNLWFTVSWLFNLSKGIKLRPLQGGL